MLSNTTPADGQFHSVNDLNCQAPRAGKLPSGPRAQPLGRVREGFFLCFKEKKKKKAWKKYLEERDLNDLLGQFC